MSYNHKLEVLDKTLLDVQKIQYNILKLIKTLEKNNIKINPEDLFLFKELKNKFKLDHNMATILLNVNIMNYSLYLKSIDKESNNIKKKIQNINNN